MISTRPLTVGVTRFPLRDLEPQERAVLASEGRGESARLEVGLADEVRREDAEAAAAAHVLLLADGLVEVNDLVEGDPVDEDEVVARASPAHGEGGELPGRGNAG